MGLMDDYYKAKKKREEEEKRGIVPSFDKSALGALDRYQGWMDIPMRSLSKEEEEQKKKIS